MWWRIYLCRSRNLPAWWTLPKWVRFKVWYRDGRCPYYECNRWLWGADTYKFWLCVAVGSCCGRGTRKGFAPLIRTQEQVCLYNWFGTCGLVVKNFYQFYDVLVRGQQLQSLDFLQLLHFLNCFIFLLHAFDSHELAVPYWLSHKHFWKSALSLLRLQPVLVHL